MQSEEETKNKVFRYYLKQPIHKTLIQLRIVSVSLIFFCMYFLWDMWVWFKSRNDLPDGWDVAFWAFAGSILGIIWKAIQNIQDGHKRDEHDL